MRATQDYRLFERFLARFPAKFKDTRDDYGQNVYLRDASAEGVRITTKERLYLNDNVAVEVDIPDGMGPMNIRGEVKWIKLRDESLWDVGIKLHRMKMLHMSRLYKFVAPNPAE